MVDLMGQYNKIKNEIDKNIIDTIRSGKLINGPIVKEFSKNLAEYLDVKHVITCANGTDALQISYMSLGLQPGDEIICPSWTYIATAEAAALLGIKVVFCDIDINTFNVTADHIRPLINKNTRAIVAVHLYGQSCEMNDIIDLANQHDLKIIEDNAQAIGCTYSFGPDDLRFTGTIGDIGITSFYPSKNLGAYGDGGAIFTNDDLIAEKARLIANHGQDKRYHHKIVGCNSRLDSVQAAILNIKLKNLDNYNSKRKEMANNYNSELCNIEQIETPFVIKNSEHVYHQYTLKINNNKRDKLKEYLSTNGIPTMIYYPIPIHMQKAFYKKDINYELNNTDLLTSSVLSLPIHSEVENSNQDYIIEKLLNFFK